STPPGRLDPRSRGRLRPPRRRHPRGRWSRRARVRRHGGGLSCSSPPRESAFSPPRDGSGRAWGELAERLVGGGRVSSRGWIRPAFVRCGGASSPTTPPSTSPPRGVTSTARRGSAGGGGASFPPAPPP